MVTCGNKLGGKVDEVKRFTENRLVVRVFWAAIVAVGASALILSASFQGVPQKIFRFIEPITGEIPADSDIAGWASFDKDSYMIGELVRYRIHLVWRNNVISPDLEIFGNSIALLPLSRRDVMVNKRDITDGTSEYVLEYVLQAVDVVPSSSYEFPSPVVYYTNKEPDAGEFQSFTIQSPLVHIGGYYPGNVSKIPLLDIKGEINDPEELRQMLILLTGGFIFLLALILVKHFGQKRSVDKLSEPERLWREFHGLDQGNIDNRICLLYCEQIFTRLLDYKLGISPMMFWSGKDPEDDVFWKNVCERIRALLIHSYLRDDPDDKDVETMTAFLNEIFALLVEEEQLHREAEPSLLNRLKQQPYVIITSSTLVAISLILFTTAAFPSLWISADIARYNQSVRAINNEFSLHSGYEQLTVIADQVKDERVKAAAFYNAGTLVTNPRLSRIDPARHEALLQVMFQEQKIFLDALLHAIDIDDEFELITILTDTARRLTQGEIAMKSAIRISPDDVDIQRNFELLVKRRKAYADTIKRLLEEEDAVGMGEVMSQALIDIEAMMEMEMPDEYSEMEKKGKDDKSYFIMERF
jgi:hypothetical protein